MARQPHHNPGCATSDKKLKGFATRILLVAITLLFPALAVNAEDITIDNIVYTLNNDLTATVKDGKTVVGEVIIPEIIEHNDIQYKVTKVGNTAFQGNKQITNLVLANTIISIGDFAIDGCTGMQNLIRKTTQIDVISI